MESKIRTYEEMKDSGMEWLGRVPGHWKISKMKAFLRNSSVKDHPDALVLSLYRDYGVVPKDSRDDNHNVTSEDTASYKYVEAGDLVINKMKAWQGSLGLSRYTGIVSPAYYVCKFTSKGISPGYLHHLIRSQAYAQEFERLSTGMRVGQWDLGIDDFLRVPLLLPPLSEQAAIAAYLDDKCGAIDDIITEAKAGIEEYKAWKASVIFEAVTKGLDPNAEMKDSGVEWIGQMPKHWSCVPMKFMLKERNQKNDPVVTSERLSLSIDIGVTLYAEKTTNLDRFKEDVSQYKVAHAGDLVLNSMNMIVGAVGIAPLLGCVSPAYYVFYDNDDSHTLAKFCDYIFKNKRLRGCLFSLGQGIMAIDRGDGRVNTCRLKVSRDDLGRIMLPCPSVEEQREIISYLDDKCAAIDGIIAEKEVLIAELETYKKSLIFETVTGKRRVC